MPLRSLPRRPLALGLTATTVAALVLGAPAAAAPPAADPVLEWYDATAAAIAAGGAPTQVTNSRTWAIGWLAAARALRTGEPGRSWQNAALAGAVHQTLVTLVPGQAAAADTTLAASLSRIPDGPAKERGVVAGRSAADALIAERAGDGLDPAAVNTPFPVPAPAPGVWQPTPPGHAAATQYGNRVARPFALDRPDQYRPGPPPAVGSARYRADLAEVRAYGGATSTARTAAQTDTATFWLGSSLTLYTGILRAAVAPSRARLADRVRLVAVFHVALVDTQIATADAKYAYQRWRPVTAIRTGDLDPDPEWLPLHTTPAHPDYPSGHNTYSGAAEGVLTALVGRRSAQPYTISSPSAPGVTRTYTDWHRPSRENVDARVWSGIHTRNADEAGIRLGLDVAAHTVREAPGLLH
ncbi:vanadium-dependent haloperoxidase [Jidongwangia harbinensis]|uniref:vanadium-dependent haloperoxidase n=1 Tax=Jidongwangia harbinensis TaxID=2878561 RepID=UPI001CD92520|nr:vanadium-dependent haloperoxidase [Jidongwangia harbinensis]MCA2217380.1 vanadium-dependent haloperoxidase [Jidongwangia harbinensis]